MAHYLAAVRQSMLSCRRVDPIPQDFLQALHTHQLSLRSLLPHFDPPVPPERSQYPLQSEPPLEDEHQQLRSLGLILNDTPGEEIKPYVPKHFPEFPSKHTYKSTADFPNREVDPRKVRERATEEGRLGEEALRRLVAAGSSRPIYNSQKNQRSDSLRAKKEEMFMETMAAVTEGASEEMDLDADAGSTGKGKQIEGDLTGTTLGIGRFRSTANSEKRYWRKPAPPAGGINGGN